jgi:hypothetical protein
VLSIPKEIPHSNVFNYRFWNKAGLSQVCSSPIDQELFYDKINPDIHFTLPGVSEASLLKEYVNNA